MDNPQVRRRTSILARGSVVRVAVFLCIAMVMAMTASLWSHWATIKEPTTAIAVLGDYSLEGARVVVEGTNDETQHQSPVEVKLSSQRNFAQAIYRYPGTYRVTAFAPGAGQPVQIAAVEMTIDRFHGAQVDLPTTVTIIGTPGDRITLHGENGASKTYDPNSENKYKIVLYLGPGKYRMTRTNGGAVIPPDEEIVVEAHKPREITLPRIQ